MDGGCKSGVLKYFCLYFLYQKYARFSKPQFEINKMNGMQKKLRADVLQFIDFVFQKYASFFKTTS
jgi:hypothetical protein